MRWNIALYPLRCALTLTRFARISNLNILRILSQSSDVIAISGLTTSEPRNRFKRTSRKIWYK